MHTPTLHPATLDFFQQYCAIGYDPKIETEADARRRIAQQLFDAYNWANDNNLRFVWGIDLDTSASDCIEGVTRENDYNLWECIMSNDTTPLACFGGIDFGPSAFPHENPYARIIEAYLAEQVYRNSTPAPEQ